MSGAELVRRIIDDPVAWRMALVAATLDAPPALAVENRDKALAVDAYVKKYDRAALLEVRRAARLIEHHMAHMWPAGGQRKQRTDDRPYLDASKQSDQEAWNRIYQVGRCGIDWIYAQTEPDSLTQAAVIRHAVDKDKRTSSDGATIPAGRFATIVADPPWPMTKSAREATPEQGNRLDYPTMSVEDIAAYPVPDTAAENAHLYLWTTHRFLPDALRIAERWGFAYHCLLTWTKPGGFTPFSWQFNTEHVVFAYRGKFAMERMGLKTGFTADRGRHSEKPDIFYELAEQVSPGPRLELFSRRPRPGWETSTDEEHVA